ncbi:MAG: DUF4328 domain-containing protein [Pseudonocardiaceae bacterium]
MQQPPPGQGLAFERSGTLTSALVGVAVAWTVTQWLVVLAAPSAVQTYQDAIVNRTPISEISTTYDLLAIPLSLIGVAAFVLTGIWLTRARHNADRIAPDQQRRSPVWVWLGWVVPIVSLWFPKQVVDDVWRSTVRQPDRPDTGLWWGTWIAAQVLSALAAQAFGLTGEPRAEFLEFLVLFEGLAALLTTVAVLQWIRVVRIISRAQDELADTASRSPWDPRPGHPDNYGYPGNYPG